MPALRVRYETDVRRTWSARHNKVTYTPQKYERDLITYKGSIAFGSGVLVYRSIVS
jgi:hypothetical protein